MKLTSIAILLLFLASCKEEKFELKSLSPNKAITLTVTAQRSMSVEPWVTNLVAEGPGLKGNIQFEFYGSEITGSTVQFNWESDEKCTITFVEKDDGKRVFLFTPGSSTALWTDLSEK